VSRSGSRREERTKLETTRQRLVSSRYTSLSVVQLRVATQGTNRQKEEGRTVFEVVLVLLGSFGIHFSDVARF
jgi:hypothetical protein